jgi:hypothetical protein
VLTLELHATGIGESLKVKPPDLTALDVCLKGAASVCSCWSARLVAKCHGGTFKLLVPRCLLPSKVVSRRRMACPMLCSLRPMPGGTSSSLCYIVVTPPSPCRSGVSGGFLWSAWCKDMESLCGHVGCRG